MKYPLMPKATAVWLVENTSLTFEQIAEFCGMHPLEIRGIADGEVFAGLVGYDPVASNQLKRQEIIRCEQEKTARLKLNVTQSQQYNAKKKQKRVSKYTPVARRQDKPDAIAWLIKNLPNITDIQISQLIGTTKKTIAAIRERTHWNMANITPHDPVLLSLCTQSELDNLAQILKMESERKQALQEQSVLDNK